MEIIETAGPVADASSRRLRRWLRGLSARFIRLPADEIDAAIEDGLRQIVEFLDADRSTLFEFSPDGASMNAVKGWARPGIEVFRSPLAEEQFPWYYRQLAAGRTVSFEDISHDVPPEAVKEREYAVTVGLRSNLTIPVVVAGSVSCALAVGSFRSRRRWTADTVEEVSLAAEILSAGLLRARGQRQLVRTQVELQRNLDEVSRLKKLLEEENLYLQEEIRLDHDFDAIVGDSEPMHSVLSRVEPVAATDATVLILGETGTGKELLAHAIHDRSARSKRALVKVNCASLPSSLIESELFGHERGAFTGAVASKKGRFELADGGTLFLDEIGDLELELQAKLLRVLESGELERVGSSRTMRVDVRIIAATHRDLSAAVAREAFRADLFHRLHVFPIEVPPLRERREDIPLLVWHFLSLCEREWGRRIHTVAPPVMDALRSYSWPGNVRELKNVIERAVILSPGDRLQLDPGSLGPIDGRSGGERDDRLDAVQRSHIRRVLDDCGWRINGPGNAAERLGIHPNTLRHRMKKLRISRPG